MLRRIAKGVTTAGFAAFALLLVVIFGLYVLSFVAPPPVEAQSLNYADDPETVVRDATHNLRASEYAYTVTVTRTNTSAGTRETTALQHTRIDNRARTYYSQVRTGYLLENRSLPPNKYYGSGIGGYKRIPEGVTVGWVFGPDGSGEWTGANGYGYTIGRNALDSIRLLGDSDAAVVAENETTYVAEVTNDSVAVAVGYPRLDVLDTENATANLTVRIDKRTGHVTSAVLRYRNVDGIRIRAEYDLHHHGRTTVRRPFGAYPPGIMEFIHRLDLGVRTLDSLLAVGIGSPLVDGGGVAW